MREIARVLHDDFIIRRRKTDVLAQLPAFRRSIVHLEQPSGADLDAADALAWQVRRTVVRRSLVPCALLHLTACMCFQHHWRSVASMLGQYGINGSGSTHAEALGREGEGGG